MLRMNSRKSKPDRLAVGVRSTIFVLLVTTVGLADGPFDRNLPSLASDLIGSVQTVTASARSRVRRLRLLSVDSVKTVVTQTASEAADRAGYEAYLAAIEDYNSTDLVANTTVQDLQSEFVNPAMPPMPVQSVAGPSLLTKNTVLEDVDVDMMPASRGHDLRFERDRPLIEADLRLAPTLGDEEGEKYLPETDPDDPRVVIDYKSSPMIGSGYARTWYGNCYAWEAPNFYHRRLYFEQPNLERYGHYYGSWKLQSALSTAHFFAAIPALPLKAMHTRPCERVYTLGHYRPGNCNPHFRPGK